MHVKGMLPSRNLDAVSWCGQSSSYQPYLCKLGTPERTKEQKISYWKTVQSCAILQQKRHFCCLDLYNRWSKNNARLFLPHSTICGTWEFKAHNFIEHATIVEYMHINYWTCDQTIVQRFQHPNFKIINRIWGPQIILSNVIFTPTTPSFPQTLL